MIALADLTVEQIAIMRRSMDSRYPREGCGVMLRGDGDRWIWFPCENVDPEPAHGFAVGERDMALLAALVKYGWRLAVIAHSHCDQPATFSERDRHFAAAWPDTLHLVFAVTDKGVIAQHAYNALGVCQDEPVMEPA